MYSVTKSKQFTKDSPKNWEGAFFSNMSEDDIFAIIKNLNYKKSHGWDDLSIKMIKLCSKSVAYPFKLISEASLLGKEYPKC